MTEVLCKILLIGNSLFLSLVGMKANIFKLNKTYIKGEIKASHSIALILASRFFTKVISHEKYS